MVTDDYVLEICLVSFLFLLHLVSRRYPVSNKPVSLNYASCMTNHTLDRICDMDTYFITYPCCCVLYELLLMVRVPLQIASASQKFFWACSFFLFVFRPFSVSWQPRYHCAFVSSDAGCTCSPPRHSIPGCQEKQTPVPRPFLGHGQSIVIRRIWSVCNSCSVQPSGITLFYTRMLCWVSWYLWLSDALTHQSSRPSILLRWLSNILSDVIALKSKEVGVILSRLVITNCRSKQINLNPPPTLLFIHPFGQRVKFMLKL